MEDAKCLRNVWHLRRVLSMLIILITPAGVRYALDIPTSFFGPASFSDI